LLRKNGRQKGRPQRLVQAEDAVVSLKMSVDFPMGTCLYSVLNRISEQQEFLNIYEPV
jgi:hypothetical protein